MDAKQLVNGLLQALREADSLRQRQSQLLAEVEITCRTLLASNPDSAILHFLLGGAAIRQGRTEDGIASLRHAVLYDNQNYDYHSEVFHLLMRLGRTAEAVQAAETMALCLPDSPRPYEHLTNAYLTAGRSQDATIAFRRALAINPGLRKVTQAETHKARARRQRDGFFEAYCQGQGLDIGWGGDLLSPNCTGWDIEDGDSETLDGIADASYDFVYSSHNLEHLPHVETAVANMWRVVKPGGYVIIFLPHRDLYEKKRTLPSRFADQHKRFFLPENDDPPDTLGVRQMVSRLLPQAEVVYIKTCDEGHTITDPNIHSDGEYSIETVLRKPAV